MESTAVEVPIPSLATMFSKDLQTLQLRVLVPIGSNSSPPTHVSRGAPLDIDFPLLLKEEPSPHEQHYQDTAKEAN